MSPAVRSVRPSWCMASRTAVLVAVGGPVRLSSVGAAFRSPMMMVGARRESQRYARLRVSRCFILSCNVCSLLWSIVDSCLYPTLCDCSTSCFDPVHLVLAYLWLGLSWIGCISKIKHFPHQKQAAGTLHQQQAAGDAQQKHSVEITIKLSAPGEGHTPPSPAIRQRQRKGRGPRHGPVLPPNLPLPPAGHTMDRAKRAAKGAGPTGSPMTTGMSYGAQPAASSPGIRAHNREL